MNKKTICTFPLPVFLVASLAFLVLMASLAGVSAEEIPLLTGKSGDQSSIFVHLPEPALRTGAALIVCPGGGYTKLSMDVEGHDVAEWFNARGVAVFVLKYRLPAKPGNGTTAPLDDAHAAILEVRQRAAQWGVDPHRIGLLGFSAGGHVAATAGTHFEARTRPDFLLLIYPVITMGEFTHGGSRQQLLGSNPAPAAVRLYSNELQVTRETPPTFLVHASDDRAVSARNSVSFYLALLAAGVPAELHIYETGDHGLRGGKGYGIGAESGTVSATWPQRAVDWMTQRGWLGPKPGNYRN